MTDRNQALLAAYEEIGRLLRILAGDQVSSYQRLVDQLSPKVYAVRRNAPFLMQLADIRHVLAHPADARVGHPFEISERLIAHAQEIAQKLHKVPRAKDLGTSTADLFVAARSDGVQSIIRVMRDRRFSHVPILAANKVEGVFSENTLFEYLYAEEIASLDEKTTVADVFAHCEIGDRRLERYQFTHPTRFYEEVVKMFTEGLGASERVGAVFVTDTGNPGDRLQRMITAWDVLGTS